jgi:hypothetical protein
MKINNWWMLSDMWPKYRGRCKTMVKLLLGSLPGVDYVTHRCRACNSDVAIDNVAHFLTRCQENRLVQLRALLYRNISQCTGEEFIAHELVLYLCLGGQIDNEYIVDIMNIIHSMYRIRLEMYK